MKIFPLYEGSFSVDSSKKFIPFNPEVDNPKDRPGSLFIYVQPFLVQTKNELLLMDAGLGVREANGELQLYNNIRKAGFEPDDITKVLMSHLHYDHSGGMMYEENGNWKLSFPHADYFVQRGEMETGLVKQSKSYTAPVLEHLWRTPNLHLIEGNGKISDEISFELTGGHCEFHQVYLIESEGEKVFFGGDILPEPEQLLRKFIAKYDYDGRKAMELREHYGKLAAENDWTCLFYHAKSKATGKVKYNEGSFTVI
ncbi:MBL fold metallo-hydrolase [Solitalea sp. MAHUQ-68]|uniref:MBL fold metallo-hydrolase n=1 Tax=Solitalea agri TaxID=2953739 RepID=A0A9X2JC70_9SPHI|nr:MBL fold metallo-hydrolase [Solitalea agri]MCO4293227.1 MBL fold metallo-hydrolase [Solitalea agri]